MKHLKKFNEELNPSTYINAGQKLIKRGQNTRGQKLYDHGMEAAGIDDTKFTVYSNGYKFDVEWNPTKKLFVADPKTHNLPYTSVKFLVVGGTNLESLRLQMETNARSGTSFKTAYVNNRPEAIRLLKFLHSLGYKNGSVNNLYSEDAVETKPRMAKKGIDKTIHYGWHPKPSAIDILNSDKTTTTKEPSKSFIKKVGDWFK